MILRFTHLSLELMLVFCFVVLLLTDTHRGPVGIVVPIMPKFGHGT